MRADKNSEFYIVSNITVKVPFTKFLFSSCKVFQLFSHTGKQCLPENIHVMNLLNLRCKCSKVNLKAPLLVAIFLQLPSQHCWETAQKVILTSTSVLSRNTIQHPCLQHAAKCRHLQLEAGAFIFP